MGDFPEFLTMVRCEEALRRHDLEVAHGTCRELDEVLPRTQLIGQLVVGNEDGLRAAKSDLEDGA